LNVAGVSLGRLVTGIAAHAAPDRSSPDRADAAERCSRAELRMRVSFA